MNNNYYEIGTVGTTPIYEPVRAKRRALGKLYTESELQKAIKEERERRNMNIEVGDNADTAIYVDSYYGRSTYFMSCCRS